MAKDGTKDGIKCPIFDYLRGCLFVFGYACQEAFLMGVPQCQWRFFAKKHKKIPIPHGNRDFSG